MGRPPNNPARRGDASWVHSPLWLTGERPPTKKSFVVPIPAVDSRVHAAIQSRIAGHQPAWLAQRAELGDAEAQLVQLREHQEAAAQRFQDLQQSASQKLHEIAALREQQLNKSLLDIQSSLLQDFQQTQTLQKQAMERECEQLLQQEAPPLPKRIKLSNEEEMKQVADEQQDTKDSELGEQGQQVAEDAKPAAAVDDNAVASAGGDVADETPPAEPKASDIKKQELEAVQGQLDALTETKSQLIWLLKQVIKAEAKNKLQTKLPATSETKTPTGK